MIENVRTFLETPRIAYLSTIDLQGYPHTVPVWFAVDGEDLIFSLGTSRARFRHIAANSNAAVTIGGNAGDPQGYLIKGKITIDDDPSQVLMNKVIGRYISGEARQQFLDRAAQEVRIIFRLAPVKVIRVR